MFACLRIAYGFLLVMVMVVLVVLVVLVVVVVVVCGLRTFCTKGQVKTVVGLEISSNLIKVC